jgi:hypothetical protein
MIMSLLNMTGTVLSVLALVTVAAAEILLWLCDRPSHSESATSRAQRAAQAVRAQHITDPAPAVPDVTTILATVGYHAGASGHPSGGVTP